MATTARTWFYAEPEHRPYYIEERVNQNLWAMRFGGIYLDCVSAEPPFRMEGKWNDIALTMEWVPNRYLRLTADQENKVLVAGYSQMLQMPPLFSYVDENGIFTVEWWRTDEGKQRYNDIQGRPGYTNVKTYKK
ncbi:MAG: hypothetical protein OHK0023_03490 [Anaerolineae bacterium]